MKVLGNGLFVYTSVLTAFKSYYGLLVIPKSI